MLTLSQKISVIHVDAHADVNDTMFGEKETHGTWMRRALEEGLVDASSSIQIGLRGSGYSAEDFEWPKAQVRQDTRDVSVLPSNEKTILIFLLLLRE